MPRISTKQTEFSQKGGHLKFDRFDLWNANIFVRLNLLRLGFQPVLPI